MYSQRCGMDCIRTGFFTVSGCVLFRIFRFHEDLIAVLTACALSSGAAPLAYVPNAGSGTVSVIDTGKDEVVARIETGSNPVSVVHTVQNTNCAT
jgi:YVTN family beta-propeller protein